MEGFPFLKLHLDTVTIAPLVCLCSDTPQRKRLVIDTPGPTLEFPILTPGKGRGQRWSPAAPAPGPHSTFFPSTCTLKRTQLPCSLRTKERLQRGPRSSWARLFHFLTSHIPRSMGFGGAQMMLSMCSFRVLLF